MSLNGDNDSLGPCCNCGVLDGVRSIIMLPRRAPIPGTGWGCVVCDLPADGAVAVLCDDCVHDDVKAVCKGYAKAGVRVPISELSDEVFEHDKAKHAEND